jgi:hypothetical protein
MALGTAASGPGGYFLEPINSRDLNKYKFNQKTRSIHVFTFREAQNPDRLDTFDFDKLTLEILTSARKQKTILNYRLKTFDRYCISFRYRLDS